MTSKNLVYLDMLDSQQSKMNWRAFSSNSGFFIPIFNAVPFDEEAAIYNLVHKRG